MDILVNDQTASIKLLSKPSTWYGIRYNCVFKNKNISPLQWTLNIKFKTFYKYYMNESFRQLNQLFSRQLEKSSRQLENCFRQLNESFRQL
jgi:hypothetical protein